MTRPAHKTRGARGEVNTVRVLVCTNKPESGDQPLSGREVLAAVASGLVRCPECSETAHADNGERDRESLSLCCEACGEHHDADQLYWRDFDRDEYDEGSDEHVQVTRVLEGPHGIFIRLDRSQVIPDDPGAGSPALVHEEEGQQRSGTFWCVRDMGEWIDGEPLDRRQQEWLDQQEGIIEEFLY